jgi:hypothetical protein
MRFLFTCMSHQVILRGGGTCICELDDTPRVAVELVEHELKYICLYSYEKERKEVHAEFSIAS